MRRVLPLAPALLMVSMLAYPTLPASAATPTPRPGVVDTLRDGTRLETLTLVKGAATSTPSGIPAADRGDTAQLSESLTTGPMGSIPFTTVGVTWTSGFRQSINVWLRTQSTAGAPWSAWTLLPTEPEHAPDGTTAESGASLSGTEPSWTGAAISAQIRVETTTGQAPGGLAVHLIDGRTAAATPPAATTAAAGRPQAARTAATSVITAPTSLSTVPLGFPASVPQPTILPRSAWGADESIRRHAPEYAAIRGAFVHHTVNANSYTSADVPALIRGIYLYHVKTQGWSDIGYNVLVDKYGRMWEGRAGGLDRAVIGAHTYGHNSVAFAMASIGDHTTSAPSSSVLAAFQRYFAWKFSIHHVDPRKPTYYSEVAHNPIEGHRDVYPTSCPGTAFYALLPALRTSILSALGTWPRMDHVVGVGDITGDGSNDIAGIEADGRLRIYPGVRETGGFLPSMTAGYGWDTVDQVMGPGDLSGDGVPDLVARDRRTGQLWLYPTTIGGSYTTRQQIGTGWLPFMRVVALGDVTGDGFPDIGANDDDGKLWVYPTNGAGGWLPRYLGGQGWERLGALTGAGDLTGDGISDLVGRTPAGELYLYPGPGAATVFATRTLLGTGFTGVDAIVGVGQWTPDNYPDLVMRTIGTRRLHIVYGGAASVLPGRQIGSGW